MGGLRSAPGQLSKLGPRSEFAWRNGSDQVWTNSLRGHEGVFFNGVEHVQELDLGG